METYDPTSMATDERGSNSNGKIEETCADNHERLTDTEHSILSKLSPLPCFLVAIGAVDDTRYTPDQIHAWKYHTSDIGEFAEEWVGGGHSYLTEENPREILSLIRAHLSHILCSKRLQ